MARHKPSGRPAHGRFGGRGGFLVVAPVMDGQAAAVQDEAQPAVPKALERLLQQPDEQQGEGHGADAGQKHGIIDDAGRGEGLQQDVDQAEAGEQTHKQGHEDSQTDAAVFLLGVEDDGVLLGGNHRRNFSTMRAARYYADFPLSEAEVEAHQAELAGRIMTIHDSEAAAVTLLKAAMA